MELSKIQAITEQRHNHINQQFAKGKLTQKQFITEKAITEAFFQQSLKYDLKNVK